MFKYNILTEEVKSDFAFEVIADSISDLFRGAGIAMMMAMVDVEKLEAEKTWKFDLKSESLELLLFDFLGELIYLKDVDSVLFKDFEIVFTKEEKLSLKCSAQGSLIDYSKYEILTDVKAVTMHEFCFERRDEDWYCHIIVDL